MSIQSPLIWVKKLTKTYRMGATQVQALRGIDLRVRKGEFVALMGASGSGKSTLLQLLGCLDTPTSGTYLLDGRDVTCLSRDARSRVRNRHIGFVFQNFNLLPRLNALENAALPLAYRGRVSQTRSLVADALCRVGLSDRVYHRPNELSGGERQRVALACFSHLSNRIESKVEPATNR